MHQILLNSIHECQCYSNDFVKIINNTRENTGIFSLGLNHSYSMYVHETGYYNSTNFINKPNNGQ